MALNTILDESVVVGFLGAPLVGAAGLRAPLFLDPSGRFFAAPATPDTAPEYHSKEEVEQLEQIGQLVQLPAVRAPRIPEGVILYAHHQFLSPGPDALSLEAGAGWALSGGTARYLPRGEALAIMETWGKALLGDADRHLLQGTQGAERAFKAAQRARYCAPPKEHGELRFQVFVRLVASWTALKRPPEHILRDARRDYKEDRLTQIQEEASRLLAPPATFASFDDSRNRLRQGQQAKRATRRAA